jgi:hypothetical protein
VLYRDAPSDERRATLSRFLEEIYGFTPDQAWLFASTVLDQNAEASADAVMTNGTRITGSWILPEQDGNVRIVAKYNEGDVAVQYRSHLRAQGREVRVEYNNGPFFQSSYSRPKMSLQRGMGPVG